ncbi:MAG: transcriptional regulator [Candidatus Hermodarchaeota archaeon]
MKPPCVMVVSHLLPAIRILVAELLIEEYGLRQKDVAEKMDLTPAAITQYLKKIRGNQEIIDALRSNDAVFTKIRQIGQYLADGEAEASSDELITLVCEICSLIREDGNSSGIEQQLISAVANFSSFRKRNTRK